MSTSLCLKSASVMLLLSAAAASAAPSVVALSGTSAPGGGTFGGGFTNPVINATGQVVFNANINAGTSATGIFTGTPGSLQAAALQGTAAPATTVGGTSPGNYGTLYSSATTISDVLNGSGELAFTAPLTGGTSNSGIFTDTAGTVSAVALNNTPAPAGGNFGTFLAAGINQSYSPVLNDFGTVGIQSTLTGGTAAAGIFLGSTAATLQTGVLVGQTSPLGTPYATTVTVPTLNSTGQIAFVSLTGTPTAKQGIFAGTPGSIQTVMYQGNAAPGTAPYNLLYGTPTTTYSFNSAAQASFITSLTGGSLGQPTSGVFAGAAGSVQNVALNNTAAPGASGGSFTVFSNATINANSQVTFTGNMTGGIYGAPGSGGTFNGSGSGAFYEPLGGSLQPIALAGFNSPDGSEISGIASAIVQNDLGQVAFVTNLTGAGVTTGANSVELDGGFPGALMEIVRQGDQISVDSGPLRTVSGIGLLGGTGGSDGKGMVLNDSGEVAYRLTFTDGSSGIFESAVPEPASLGLLAMGAGILMRRNRTRIVTGR